MDEMRNTFEYNLTHSPLKESVLNWYEFGRDADVLLIGERCLGLKDFFERVCGTVTLYNERENRLYDFAVSLDEIEKCPEPEKAVEQWLSAVKPEGKLILSCDNRFGLKYLCGTPDKYSDIPYMGVNGYFKGLPAVEAAAGECLADSAGRCYSRQELTGIIKRAGGERCKFFYPVPDSRMPQMIYTDSSRNGTSSVTRLADYDYEDPRMLGIEHRIFGEMIDSGALGFCGNSFIVEITKTGELSDISYAVVTTDRGPKCGMATTVRESGLVYKRPLYEEGIENLKKLQNYTDILAETGVPVVKSTLKTDACGTYMEMPYVDAGPLTEVLDELIKTDRDKFLALFDKIYENETRGRRLCIQNETQPPSPDSHFETGGRSLVFIDLAPCNCFYVGGEEPLLFYDQEFVAEEEFRDAKDEAAVSDKLIKYAMYRTIKYYFASSRPAREVMKAEELMERYGITPDMFDELQEREDRFLEEVRNTSNYDWLYKSAAPDYKNMLRRAEKSAEKRKPYRVGYVPGVFDLFHKGHLRLIERCKERCEYLIVGVLTDELVHYYKDKYPVVSCEDRMAVIRGLAAVDEVIPVDFSNTDKLDAWEQLHYDCHFSGDDHVNHWKDVHEALKARGSNMEFFSYTQGISTTMIKGKIGEQ